MKKAIFIMAVLALGIGCVGLHEYTDPQSVSNTVSVSTAQNEITVPAEKRQSTGEAAVHYTTADEIVLPPKGRPISREKRNDMLTAAETTVPQPEQGHIETQELPYEDIAIPMDHPAASVQIATELSASAEDCPEQKIQTKQPAAAVPQASISSSDQTQEYDHAENGWRPTAAEHYHGNGTDCGVCPACGLCYGPGGGEVGALGPEDGMMD